MAVLGRAVPLHGSDRDGCAAGCGVRSADRRLRACEACLHAFYCSDECRRSHAAAHAAVCCAPSKAGLLLTYGPSGRCWGEAECGPGPHMVPSHTVHLPLGALLTPCTMCGTGAGSRSR